MFDPSSLIRALRRACARFALGLLFAAVVPLAAAQTIELKPGHPQSYTVVRGDTLWDIAGRFLAEPWLWPEIWDDNPQIENPHLIYPGDELVLVYVEGRPRLRRVPTGVVKLSPQVRATSLEGGAIPPLPIDAIAQFLRRPRVVTQEQIDASPYIVSVGQEHLIAGLGSKVYVRGLDPVQVDSYAVYRQGQEYRDPANPDVLLGYEALHIGDAVLRADGDPATMIVTRSNREVLVGDRLLPSEDDIAQVSYVPRPPPETVAGTVISVVDGVSQVGQYQVVVLNLGAEDGIEPGHVLAVFQRGEEIIDEYARSPKDDIPEPEAYIERDPSRQGGLDGFALAADRLVRSLEDAITPDDSYRRVRLPAERAGVVMVFRRFDRISYALVMNAERAIHVEDLVRNP